MHRRMVATTSIVNSYTYISLHLVVINKFFVQNLAVAL